MEHTLFQKIKNWFLNHPVFATISFICLVITSGSAVVNALVDWRKFILPPEPDKRKVQNVICYTDGELRDNCSIFYHRGFFYGKSYFVIAKDGDWDHALHQEKLAFENKTNNKIFYRVYVSVDTNVKSFVLRYQHTKYPDVGNGSDRHWETYESEVADRFYGRNWNSDGDVLVTYHEFLGE